MSNTPTITLDMFPKIFQTVSPHDPILLLGASGIGKTEAVIEAAKAYGRIHYINVGATEAGFATGVYLPYKSKQGAVVVKRLVDDKYITVEKRRDNPAMKPMTIILDEVTLSSETIPDLLSLVQYMVGDQALCPTTRFVAMGNLVEDNPSCIQLPAPIMSRFSTYDVSRKPEDILKGYLPWARRSKVSHQLLAYLNHTPDKVFTFAESEPGSLYNCPRSLTRADRYMKSGNWLAVSSLIGTVEAERIKAFSRYFADIISYDQIVAKTAGTIDSAPVLYSTLETLISRFDPKDGYEVFEWLGKLTPDFRHIVETGLISSGKLEIDNTAYIEYLNGI